MLDRGLLHYWIATNARALLCATECRERQHGVPFQQSYIIASSQRTFDSCLWLLRCLNIRLICSTQRTYWQLRWGFLPFNIQQGSTGWCSVHPAPFRMRTRAISPHPEDNSLPTHYPPTCLVLSRHRTGSPIYILMSLGTDWWNIWWKSISCSQKSCCCVVFSNSRLKNSTRTYCEKPFLLEN